MATAPDRSGAVVGARVELEHGDFGERIGGDVLGREVAAVVEDDGHFVGIEHVAPDREHCPLPEIKMPLW